MEKIPYQSFSEGREDVEDVKQLGCLVMVKTNENGVKVRLLVRTDCHLGIKTNTSAQTCSLLTRSCPLVLFSLPKIEEFAQRNVFSQLKTLV
jgi:hypothetical protein